MTIEVKARWTSSTQPLNTMGSAAAVGARPRRQFLGAAGAAAAGLALPRSLRAQSDKPPIKVLIGFPPGGATDAIGRLVIDRLPAELGQPVVVDNRPGAGGRIAADAVLAAAADGLTYMVAPNATPTFQMLVFGHQVKWNILRDFAGVACLATYPLGMAVSLATGANNVREFVAWAKANPEKANFGTPGLGGQNHFLGVQLAKAAGIALQVTPYKGSPPMVTDLLGGHVPAAISLMDGLMAHHRAGKLKVIGTFTPERSALMPDIPIFAEQGVNITSGLGWTGMWARAGTPSAEIERMQRAVQRIVAQPEVREAMSKRLWVQPHFLGPEQMTQMQRAELAHWEPIIKASGFKPES
jgi:tripartite-type tricarboxylate transporter receptor subunit TctC